MKNKLKGYRVMAGYTQKEMAEILGISKVSYCLKEKGKQAFKDIELKTMYEVFKQKIKNITFEELFF